MAIIDLTSTAPTVRPSLIRAAGTHVPGVVIAGRFRWGGDRVFYDVRHREQTVVVELEPGEGQPWRRLVIEVSDSRAVVEAVQKAIPTRP